MRVYIKSMQTRYFIELALFLGLAVMFQLMIGNFQSNFISLKHEYDSLIDLNLKVTTTPEMVANQRQVVLNLMADTASKLNTSMFVSLICFGFPVKTMMTSVFCGKTNTEYKIKTEDLFDFVICFLIGWWLYIYFTYRNHPAVNPQIANTPNEIFMLDIMIDRDNGTFHFEILVAAIASTFWIRMFLMLKLTKTFGPIIRMIYAMLYDLSIFLVLWGIQLFIFACVGILIFGDMEEYGSFIKVLILFFESALGQWNFEIYEHSQYPPLFGQTFHMLVIMLNMIMFVNLMIAILSETYQRLSIQKLGLYYDGVIEVIPAYKYKKFYGALIAACPPFNLFVLPFLPIFMLTRNKQRIRRLNNTLIKIIFFPFALIYASFFSMGNLIMMPVAFVCTVYFKFRVIFDRRMIEQRKLLALRFLSYLVVGLPFLAISQVVDVYYFILHLYKFNQNEISAEIVPVISAEAFNTLEVVIQREIQLVKETNFKDSMHMPTRDLIKTIREELEISTCI
jgi:hypothetical protein